MPHQAADFDDAAIEDGFDRLTRLAATILNVPIALVVLVEDERVVLKSASRLPEHWRSRGQLPLPAFGFYEHGLASGEPLVITDVREHPPGAVSQAVAELGVAAYLDIPLIAFDSQTLGSFCVFSYEPREWSDQDVRLMQDLAASVTTEIELRAAVRAAEKARREKAAMLESTSEGIYVVNPAGQCTFINRAAAEMLGYRPDEVIGRNMHELIHHSYADGSPYPNAACPILRACLRGETVHLSDETLWRRDGTSFPAGYSASPIVEGGPAQGAVVTFRDISERKQTEDSLRRREAHLRAIIETTPECVKLVAHDGTLVDMNSAGLRMIETDEDGQVFGQSVFALIAPESQQEFREFHQRVCSGERGSLEFDLIGLRGTRRRMETHAVPLISPDGVTSHLAITRDVTERRRAGRLLAGQKLVLEKILEGTPLPQVLDVLARMIENESEGLLCSILLLGEDGRLRSGAAPSLPTRFVQAVDGLAVGPRSGSCGTAAFRREAVIVSDIARDPLWEDLRDQALRHDLRASWATPILAVNGEVLGTFAIYARQPRQPQAVDFDLIEIATRLAGIAIERTRTEAALKQRAAELMDADRRKDEFLAMLAHELRNPLAPIRSGLDVLSIEQGSSETVELMRQQVDHLVRLVDDLLDVSRILRGKVELRKESVELAAIAARAIEMARPLIDARGHQLIRHFPMEPVWLDADPVRLAQVIANLLNNAAKYTEPGGRIWLTANREESGVVLQVRDTGIGIDPEYLPEVFELFTQADRSIDRAQGGLGIGLTLVRSQVELHDGTVTAESDGLGKGSCFTVRLPVPANVSRTTKRDQTLAQTPRRRVLVVDDNRGAAKMLAMLLEKLSGHDVYTADDGMQALEMFARCHPEVVVLDIGLPRMNGYEVARRLRESPRGKAILLVALTGYGQPEDRHAALDAGFDIHMVKPPTMETIEQIFLHPKLMAAGSRL